MQTISSQRRNPSFTDVLVSAPQSMDEASALADEVASLKNEVSLREVDAARWKKEAQASQLDAEKALEVNDIRHSW